VAINRNTWIDAGAGILALIGGALSILILA